MTSPQTSGLRIEVSGSRKFWRLKRLQEVLAHSETYYSKWNTKRAANKLGSLLGCPVIILD